MLDRLTAIHCPLSRTLSLLIAQQIWHSWRTVLLIASLVLITLVVSPLPASAWNIPGHMLSGAMTYQFLENEVVPSASRFGTRGRSQEEGSDMLQAHENNLNLT